MRETLCKQVAHIYADVDSSRERCRMADVQLSEREYQESLHQDHEHAYNTFQGKCALLASFYHILHLGTPSFYSTSM